MSVKTPLILTVAVSVLLTGCAMSSSRATEPAKPTSRAPVAAASPPPPRQSAAAPRATASTSGPVIPQATGPVTPINEPISPRFARPAVATDTHLQEIEPAILELARKAQAGDRSYFLPKMGQQPSEHLVESMMDKVKACDLARTYRAHLIGDRLNYHDTTHVQIELAQKDGKWDVSRLWFCR